MKAKIYDYGPSLRIFFDDDTPCQQGFTHKDNKHPESGKGFPHLQVLKHELASMRAMKFGYEQGARYFELYSDIDDDTPRTYDFNYEHKKIKEDMPVTECCGKYILFYQTGIDEYRRWDFCSECLEPFHSIKESEYVTK
jgi:hypothetical protein